MPKIVSYTPPWLSRPAAGARIFTDPAPQSPASPSKRASYFGAPNGGTSTEYQGPRRLLARRGTEIFTVVGNKIRWADLSTVKQNWDEHRSSRKRGKKVDPVRQEQDDEEKSPYRTLAVPVYYQIRQLILSPSGAFLAVCTEHTVHIAVLPDSSRLRDQDQSPLKLKTYQLGPTTHVIPESPIVSALWHPLAVATNSSDCLVTVTAEAAVRVWELDRSNQWSFERPALAIDLKKLADGVSCDDDFEPSGFGKSRGFSVDAFDMEASAACFGGHAHAEEDPWASMTLWTAMRNGDVYALCPLIPSRWTPSVTSIPSLSTRAVANAAVNSDRDNDPEQQRAASQQYEWVQEIDSEEQMNSVNGLGEEEIEVRHRPANPSAIPRLQGPFEIQLDDDFADLEVSDIHVISASLDEDELLSGEDGYADFEAESIAGLPFSLICLATTDSKVYICMDLEGVSGQWLPKNGRNSFTVPDSETKELVLADIFSPLQNDAHNSTTEWPMMSADPSCDQNFFLTTGHRLHSISLAQWCSRLGPELLLSIGDDSGLQTRLTAACQAHVSDVVELISVIHEPSATKGDLLSAPIVLESVDLGSMLLASTPSKAYAVSFDQLDTLLLEDNKSDINFQSLMQSTPPFENVTNTVTPTRAKYETPNIFRQSSSGPFKTFLTGSLPASRQHILKSPIKLSPATLEIITSAHRILSMQTSQLEKAAAELFRRCERMRTELNEQVKQMAELADRLQHISGENDDAGDVNETWESRIRKAQERQRSLVQRYEGLRRKTGRASNVSQELSIKEVAWTSEVKELTKMFGLEDGEVAVDVDRKGISGRYATVKQLAEELLEDGKAVEKARSRKDESNGHDGDGGAFHRSGILLSSRLQKEKINDVMAMVEREAAVIDAVMARLDRLNVRQ